MQRYRNFGIRFGGLEQELIVSTSGRTLGGKRVTFLPYSSAVETLQKNGRYVAYDITSSLFVGPSYWPIYTRGKRQEV